MFIAKIDTSVTPAISRRMNSVPTTIGNTMIKGKVADTRLPNTSNSTRNITGSAISSIAWRFFWIVSSVSKLAATLPPIPTVNPSCSPPNSDRRSVIRLVGSPALSSTRASTNADVPSRLFNAGFLLAVQ